MDTLDHTTTDHTYVLNVVKFTILHLAKKDTSARRTLCDERKQLNA